MMMMPNDMYVLHKWWIQVVKKANLKHKVWTHNVATFCKMKESDPPLLILSACMLGLPNCECVPLVEELLPHGLVNCSIPQLCF